MRVGMLQWISGAAQEAEVEVVDGSHACWAFSQPCSARTGDVVTTPLHVLGLRHACLDAGAKVGIRKVTQAGLAQQVTARVSDLDKGLLAVGGLQLCVEDVLPGGVQTGDIISFECGRIDLWCEPLP